MTLSTHPSNPPANAAGFAEAHLNGADLAYWFANELPVTDEHKDGIYVTAQLPGVKETLIIWIKPKLAGAHIYKHQLKEGAFSENK